MGATCTVRTLKNSCKFFTESDKKKLAQVISKIQVSNPVPFWPSCFFFHNVFKSIMSSEYLKLCRGLTGNKDMMSKKWTNGDISI